MSFFQKSQKVVDLGGGNRVVLRKLMYGERNHCLSLASSVQVGPKRSGEVVINPGILAMEMLKASIVSWSGPEFDGLPYAPALVEELDTEVADILAKAADDWNGGMGEEEKKDLTAPTSTP